MSVRIDSPALSAFLLAWGRADNGWWGLIRWSLRIEAPRAGHRRAAVCSVGAGEPSRAAGVQ
jgi:hypothetical protein